MFGRVIAIAVATLVAGCGDDQEPAKARALWERIHAENYRNWAPVAGYQSPRNTRAPHSSEVLIFANAILDQAATSPGPLSQWPVGSLAVKRGSDDGELEIVAAMEKRDDGWFYVEWNEDGDSLYSGRPKICTGCHYIGEDELRALFLPL